MRISLPLTLAVAATALAACGGDVTDSGTAKQAIAVTATDDACVASLDTVAAGDVEVTVTNNGQQVTEVYVYGAEDRVIGELENITPGLTRSFTVTVGGGEYEFACKPGQTGSGIRTPLTVTGEAKPDLEPTTSAALKGVDYAFEGLQDVTFAAGDVVAFSMENAGTVDHEFEVFAPDGEELGEIGRTAAGASGTVVLALEVAGTYRYVCGIDDHESRGMVGEFTVS